MEHTAIARNLRYRRGFNLPQRRAAAAGRGPRRGSRLAVPHRAVWQRQVQADASVPGGYEGSHTGLVQQKLRPHLSAISIENQKVFRALHRGT